MSVTGLFLAAEPPFFLEHHMPKRAHSAPSKGALRHDPRQRRPTYNQSEAQKDPGQRGAGLGEMPKPGAPETDPRERDRTSGSAVQPRNAPRR